MKRYFTISIAIATDKKENVTIGCDSDVCIKKKKYGKQPACKACPIWRKWK